MRILVIGLGASGEAVARNSAARGDGVVVVEDAPGERSVALAAALVEQGIEVVETPSPAAVARLVADADLVVPSPGVAARHQALAMAADTGVPVWSEVELAARHTSAPIVAVTGTNGKTTVTTLIAAMLDHSGVAAVAAGNIGLPLSDAVDLPADVLVVEVSSFQLEFTHRFRPRVAVWLNVAPDHQDWHPTVEAYVSAKARIWANQADDDLAVVNSDDPLVMKAAAGAPARLRTFGLTDADWRVDGGMLRTPAGEEIVPIAELPRSLPHDVSNALAASAAAAASGASLDGVREALLGFAGLPHRVTLVGEAGGVRFYDDSKATNPHAAVAAITSFDSVVLIAGGRNKGLDLRPMAGPGTRIRSVVAIGDAAAEVEEAFSGVAPVVSARTMDDAVALAARAALPGDAVLLSPGCASFDWYRSYGERGDDFARAVHELLDRT